MGARQCIFKRRAGNRPGLGRLNKIIRMCNCAIRQVGSRGGRRLDTPLPVPCLLSLIISGKGASSWAFDKARFGVSLRGQKPTTREEIFQGCACCSQSDFLWVSARKENQLPSIPKIQSLREKKSGGEEGGNSS